MANFHRVFHLQYFSHSTTDFFFLFFPKTTSLSFGKCILFISHYRVVSLYNRKIILFLNGLISKRYTSEHPLRSLLKARWSAPIHVAIILTATVSSVEDHCPVTAVHVRIVDLIGAACLTVASKASARRCQTPNHRLPCVLRRAL